MTKTRREFLQSAAAAGFGAPLVRAQGRKYRTALIGTGWWGMNILTCAMEAGQSKVVAMCDVDRNQLDPAVAKVEKLTGDSPKKYKHYGELLDREKPEIVIVGTPDHWHPLVMIAAVNAGAHVYVEKPICHTLKEGRAMVNAARAANRVVQVGTHRRVSPHNISAMKFLKSGKIGKIGMVRAFVHSAGDAGSKVPDSEPPQGLDWNLWCGPAPEKPYNKSIHPRGFRYHLDFANGVLGDWGIHWFDQILWWTEERFPKRVFSMGGRFIKQDSTDAPDTQVVSYQFESFDLVWEHRQYAGNSAEKASVGCYFYGTEGTVHLGWLDGWTFYPAKKGAPVIHENPQLHEPDSQNIKELWADFLDAIQNRRRPACDIENGHLATSMSMLGMISWRTGRSVLWDGAKETIAADAEATRLLTREYRPPWQYPKA